MAVIASLGCRIRDVETLVRRAERLPGATTRTVLESFVDESATAALERGFGENLYSDQAPADAQWKPVSRRYTTQCVAFIVALP